MANDPVVTVTDSMIEEGRFVLSVAGDVKEKDALVSLIFMAMLSTMEGGRVVFEMGEDTVARYVRPGKQ